MKLVFLDVILTSRLATLRVDSQKFVTATEKIRDVLESIRISQFSLINLTVE